MVRKASANVVKLTIPENIPYRVGEWLPSDQRQLERWLKKKMDIATKNTKPFLPVIQEFQSLIENDAQIYMLFNQMFNQVPTKPPYNKDPVNQPQVRSYQEMLVLLNEIMTSAPEFNETGLVGFPINAILDWPMGTEGGYAAFLNDTVNAMFEDILNEWGVFLQSSDSLYVLNENPNEGWLSDEAMLAMVKAMPPYCSSTTPLTPTEARKIFIKSFHCDPSKPHYGFTSWDDFFTRTFREGVRPVASPNDDNVIANACESAPYKIEKNVKLQDNFWIKGQPYSLQHMMDNDPWVEEFVNGTVYQAFLSAKSYHRWNSPVSGTIVRTCLVKGTYYSEIPDEGFYNPLHSDSNTDKQTPDNSAPNDSQAYLSEVAARAMIFIQADNPKIGLMCFMPIGMAEVSSCDITVYEGQHVNKGDELGMFHFGGSTHCLIFRPGVELDFDLGGQTPGLNSHNIAVRAKLATVKTSR